MWVTGELSFAESMDLNFIDFPRWRKGRGLLGNFPLRVQDLIFVSQPLQLSGHVLLPLLCRMVGLALASAVDPVAQSRQVKLGIRGDRTSAAAAGQAKLHGLILKSLVKCGAWRSASFIRGSLF
jgi:hypothetical protein